MVCVCVCVCVRMHVVCRQDLNWTLNSPTSIKNHGYIIYLRTPVVLHASQYSQNIGPWSQYCFWCHFAYWVIVEKKPRNLGTRIASTSEVIPEEHLGHQRRKLFLICFWFPRIHLFRASENCLKRLTKHICQKHTVPKEWKKNISLENFWSYYHRRLTNFWLISRRINIFIFLCGFF